MNNLYVIGDTHFNHEMLIREKYRPENYEEKLFRSLMMLKVTDTLIHLGDVCMGDDERQHDCFLSPLVCRKWLVRGNHERKTNIWYLEHGWDFVADSFSLTLYGKKVLFTHVPVIDDGKFDVNIHAHLHNLGHRDGEYLLVKNDKQVLYSAEDFNYVPIKVKYLIEKRGKYGYKRSTK